LSAGAVGRDRDAHSKLVNLDFRRYLVLVGTVPAPNRVIMQPMLHEDGDVRFAVAGTKIGGPGFGFMFQQIDRAGVKSVNGTPVEPFEPDDDLPHDGDHPQGEALESITVTVVGRLKSGLVGIGGETTGTTITARGITWELDLSDSELQHAAAHLDGAPVIVQGSLERRPGVEVRERFIVHVTGLQAIFRDR
jgi:hypothetical protein